MSRASTQPNKPVYEGTRTCKHGKTGPTFPCYQVLILPTTDRPIKQANEAGITEPREGVCNNSYILGLRQTACSVLRLSSMMNKTLELMYL